MTTDPNDKRAGDEADPFAEFPIDESFESSLNEPSDGDSNEPSAPVEEAPPEIDEVPAPVAVVATAPAAKKSRTTLYVGIACAVVLLGAGGYLGYDYWQSSEWAQQMESKLADARTKEDESSKLTEDSQEAALAARLTAEVDAFVNATWWERVGFRVFNAPRVEAFKSQCSELTDNAAQRNANRKWWVTTSQSVDASLADQSRTIPGMQEVLDGYQASDAPNAGAGGFDPEVRAALATKLDADIQSLMTTQNASLQQLADSAQEIRAAANLDQLAQLTEKLDLPLPTDRNPPELAQALEQVRKQASSVADFLASRDAIESELTATIATISAFDQQSGSLDAMLSIKNRLVTLSLPPDTRFDTARKLALEGSDAASKMVSSLTARDGALAWVSNRLADLEKVKTLDEMAQFGQELVADSPESDNPRVIAAAEDLLARIALRTAELQEEKRLLEASLARAALFDAAVIEYAEQLDTGKIAQAATTLMAMAPEDSTQTDVAQHLKEEFPNAANQRLIALRESANTLGNWREVATALRDAFSSDEVHALNANFDSQNATLWTEVSTEEDRTVYEECRSLAHAPYAQLAPALQAYLDPARTRGSAAPMEQQVSALLAAIENPGVTIEIEGVEWAPSECLETATSTTISVEIGENPYNFELGPVLAAETSLLGGEEPLKQQRAEPVRFGVSGFFDCADDAGVFAGSGALTMDDLRSGGRYALPFWSDGDQSTPPHKLLLVSIPDDDIRIASTMPAWIDPRPPVIVEVPVVEPATVPEVDPTPMPEEVPVAEVVPVAVPVPEPKPAPKPVPEPEPIDPTDPMNPRAIED